MVLDLNQAPEQRESAGPIPPKSIVPVRLTIRQPKEGKVGFHPMVTRSDTAYEYLDCEFEVLAGQFQGRKIWENLGLQGQTDGQKRGVEIAMRKLRAIVEAVRNINPKDASPQAAQGRRLSSPEEIQGATFGVKVSCDKPKPGDRYVNNSISLVITPDHEFYGRVMAGEELITTEPIPEIPQNGAGASPQPGWTAPASKPAAPAQGTFGGWGAKQQQQPAAKPAHTSAPAWAQPTQGPAFPSTASGMDDVPF